MKEIIILSSLVLIIIIFVVWVKKLLKPKDCLIMGEIIDLMEEENSYPLYPCSISDDFGQIYPNNFLKIKEYFISIKEKNGDIKEVEVTSTLFEKIKKQMKPNKTNIYIPCKKFLWESVYEGEGFVVLLT